MDWKALLADLLNQLVAYFGVWIKEWLESLLNKAPQPKLDDVFIVGAAPEEVHKRFETRIMEWAQQIFGNMPVIGRVALAFLNRNLGGIIDKLWDNYFKQEITAGTLPAASTFPVKAEAGPLEPLSAADLAAAKAEAGLNESA